jgi:glycosyltransferase involved in cell wall biosynthesis
LVFAPADALTSPRLHTMAIVFFKSGRWSHTNAAVERVLRERFSEHRLVVVDVFAELKRRRSLLVRLVALGLIRFRPPLHLGRGEFGFFFYTGEAQSAMREIALTVATAQLGGEPPLFTFQTTSRFCLDVLGVPHFSYVDTVESLKPLGRSGRRTRLERCVVDLEERLFDTSARTFTMADLVSRAIVDDYRGDPGRVVTVYAGTDIPQVTHHSYVDDPPPVIVFIGVDWHRKGGDVLVKAFRRIRATFPTAELRIIGAKPRVNVEGCIVFGPQTREQVAQHLQAATVLCLPARRDFFPNVIREAMHLGVPVVATRTGGIPEMIRDGESGRLVGVGDVAALTAALAELLSDQSLRAGMAAAAKRFAETHFTWESVGQAMESEIRPLLSSFAAGE